MSLVKTRLRAARRGEVPSTVGVRQPNPYENVRIFLEFAIYQTHVFVTVQNVINYDSASSSQFQLSGPQRA